MEKEKLKKLAKDPKNIEGIYNYCDRWCERCAYTSHCLNFDLVKESAIEREKLDLENKRFWDELHNIFKTTIEMISEEAEKHGIDLDNIEITDDEIKRKEEVDDYVNDHICCKIAELYVDKVKKWFEIYENNLVYENYEPESNNFVEGKNKGNEIFVTSSDKDEENQQIADITDAFDIIKWYQYFISAKTNRALHSKKMEEQENFDDIIKDSDGSAKISLIAIKRSISAWRIIMKNFGETEEDSYENIVLLEKLRRRLKQTFPQAMHFYRPGFDDKN